MSTHFKRPADSYNDTWLGAAALGVVAVLIAAVVGIGSLNLGHQSYRAEFAQAAELRPGDRVTVAGVSIGNVTGLKLAGDRVVVTFTARTDVALGEDTKAAIKLTTLLGSRYLEVKPAGSGGLENRTIGLGSTEVPYNLQQALADATTTFGAVDADNIARSLTTLSSGLSGVPEALPQALSNLGSLSAVIADRRDQLRSLLAGTDSVATLIHNQTANLGSLTLQGRDLLNEVVMRRDAVQRLFAGAAALVDTLHRVLADQPALDVLVASTSDFSRLIAEHDARFRNLLQALPIPLRNIANASGSGTGVDATVVNGILVDSWMCAISGRAKQFNLVEYFQDCA